MAGASITKEEISKIVERVTESHKEDLGVLLDERLKQLKEDNELRDNRDAEPRMRTSVRDIAKFFERGGRVQLAKSGEATAEDEHLSFGSAREALQYIEDVGRALDDVDAAIEAGVVDLDRRLEAETEPEE